WRTATRCGCANECGSGPETERSPRHAQHTTRKQRRARRCIRTLVYDGRMRTWVVVLAIASPVTVFAQSDPAAPSPPDPAGAPAEPVEASAGAVPELVTSSPPLIDEPEPEPGPSKYPDGLRVMASDLTIFRLNPLGLETRARVGVQKKLYASDKKVTENNFFF